MRLLRIEPDGDCSIVERLGSSIPRYAILSHTWGEDDEEFNFNDVMNGTGREKPGFRKVQFCGEQAAKDKLEYFWVDTCCIDKSSSTELQEAINSMFQWYSKAEKCYVYLADVSCNGLSNVDECFRKSRWFTRGWTLQELIAPAYVEFYSSEQKRIGDKNSMAQTIHDITGISIQALQGHSLHQFSVEVRKSWAANRQTKREEDLAYSLLGIFNIYMPLIYGEGRKHAFARLERKIRKSEDLPSAIRTVETHMQKANNGEGLPTFRTEEGQFSLSERPSSLGPLNVSTSARKQTESRKSFKAAPINSAAENGHIEIVKLLLANGADITVQDAKGWTPLNSAAWGGHLEVVKLLLENGADFTVPSNDYWTPLVVAAYHGHLSVVQLLLEKGADIIASTEDGWTPLNSAARGGHLEVVKLLLENGADMTVQDADGWTPLNSAAREGHEEVVKLLLDKGADFTVPSNEYWTPLVIAAFKGYLSIVQLLLDKGADSTAPTEDGWTPLDSAARGGHLEIVKLLLEKGAGIMVQDGDSTPLRSAANSGHQEAVKLLLEKGVDPAV